MDTLPVEPQCIESGHDDAKLQQISLPSPFNSIQGGISAALYKYESQAGRQRQRVKVTSLDPVRILTSLKRDSCIHMVKEINQGLQDRKEPLSTTDGMGGTYFLLNQHGAKRGIFKPVDEEPLAPNNPQGYTGRELGQPGWKPSIPVGGAAAREVAAYVLDHGGFAGVPRTCMVSAQHTKFCNSTSADGSVRTKKGSLQEFIPHESDACDVGSSWFSVQEVHRMAILDIRMLNMDRHTGNILVNTLPDQSRPTPGRPHHTITPIDHGFCLPVGLEQPYWEWRFWPQAYVPFGQEELDYIASLDADRDIELLRLENLDIEEESLRLLKVTTRVLQIGAAAGLTPERIAALFSRDLDMGAESPSDVERICMQAREEIEEWLDDQSSDDEYTQGGGDGKQQRVYTKHLSFVNLQQCTKKGSMHHTDPLCVPEDVTLEPIASPSLSSAYSAHSNALRGALRDEQVYEEDMFGFEVADTPTVTEPSPSTTTANTMQCMSLTESVSSPRTLQTTASQADTTSSDFPATERLNLRSLAAALPYRLDTRASGVPDSCDSSQSSPHPPFAPRAQGGTPSLLSNCGPLQSMYSGVNFGGKSVVGGRLGGGLQGALGQGRLGVRGGRGRFPPAREQMQLTFVSADDGAVETVVAVFNGMKETHFESFMTKFEQLVKQLVQGVHIRRSAGELDPSCSCPKF